MKGKSVRTEGLPEHPHEITLKLLFQTKRSMSFTLFSWPHCQMLGACMPKKANGSLPTMIKPINTSLKTDRKDAMCLLETTHNSD